MAIEQTDSIAEPQQDLEHSEAPANPGGSKKRLSYRNPLQREAHIAEFLTWLPNELKAAPRIVWEKLPSLVMGTLIYTTSKEPDVIPITLAAGCMADSVGQRTLMHCVYDLTRLLHNMRIQMGLENIQQLNSRSLWEAFLKQSTTINANGSRELLPGTSHHIRTYQTVSTYHLPRYVEERLTSHDFEVWQQCLDMMNPSSPVCWKDFVLPAMPFRFSAQAGIRKAQNARERAARKEQTEVLTPLHPLLVQLAILRKQALQRLVNDYQVIEARLATGDIPVPYTFVHHARIPEVNQEARTVSAVEITYREVDLQLTVWDRLSWVKAHLEAYPRSKTRRYHIQREKCGYAPEANSRFVQCHNPTQDLFWFGELVQYHLLAHKHKEHSSAAELQRAEELGAPYGFSVNRPGFFGHDKSTSSWIYSNITGEDLIFDPITLYRAALYGACAAVVALTSGARVSEFLQISDNRWGVVDVDEIQAGKATGNSIEVVVQRLLPKGGKSEQDRQFYLISEQAQPLIQEIIESLEARHGRVPVIQPTGNGKQEHLGAEPYVFQWEASPDGHVGLLDTSAVGSLLRFLFFGLEFRTRRTGEPIRIAMHLCRHVLAESAHAEHRVPWEAMTYLLHHQVSVDGRGRLSIPQVTQYYADMAPTQKLAILHELHGEIARRACTYAMRPPTKRELEEMDDWLREVFEEWGTIGPVALGFCSAGMCVRPGNRALCIGCPYLVEDHRKLGVAARWHKLYQQDIERLEADGIVADARQKRRDLQRLEDHMKIMQLQRQVLADGGRLPPFLCLPDTEEEH
jgi:hypothetical protein